MEYMIEKVKNEVKKILENDESGHDFNHTERVLNLALKFSKDYEIDKTKLSLIALLHDVDDYKLVGLENSLKLSNATLILENINFDKKLSKEILNEIKKIGYSKRLENLIPESLEGKFVSDADMCDSLGAIGILRVYDYSKSNKIPFFNKNCFPILNMDANSYREKNGSSINHFFEKLLRLKKLMLTDDGMKEAYSRNQIMIMFLESYFKENGEDDWLDYLKDYLKKENLIK